MILLEGEAAERLRRRMADSTDEWLGITSITPAFFRFPTSLFVVRRFSACLVRLSLNLSLAHYLKVIQKTDLDLKTTVFGKKSLGSLFGVPWGYELLP